MGLTALSVPSALAARYSRSRQGRDWLNALPGLVEQQLEQWGLAVDLAPGRAPWHGEGSLVLPVLRDDGGAAALKIAFPSDGARNERLALTLWNGRGVVRHLASDAGSCSLLLERLDSDRSLQSVPVDRAIDAWGALVRQLGLVPDGREQWQELEHIAALAEQWSDDLPAEWERLGRPFPRWLLEAALEVCQTRGAVGRRSGRDVLVNAEMDFSHILARPDGGSYAAIGPRPMIGEAEFAVAPLLGTGLGSLSRKGPGEGLLERCSDLSAAAGMDPEVVRQWSIAREVANAVGYAAGRQYQRQLLRSLWVASTLAGRTLDGLPDAQSVPDPGREQPLP